MPSFGVEVVLPCPAITTNATTAAAATAAAATTAAIATITTIATIATFNTAAATGPNPTPAPTSQEVL